MHGKTAHVTRFGRITCRYYIGSLYVAMVGMGYAYVTNMTES